MVEIEMSREPSVNNLFEIMPGNEEREQCYHDFEELATLLSNSVLDDGGFYWLNNNEWFEDQDLPSFFRHRIKHVQEDYFLSSILVELCSKTDQKLSKEGDPKFSKKPVNTYGRRALKENEILHNFDRGHLVANSLIKYAKEFHYQKWEDFVMMTVWCNRANTNRNQDMTCGIFYFEDLLLKTLDNSKHIDICYRVTPVFKQYNEDSPHQYDLIPRGIILEAKIISGDNFIADKVKKGHKLKIEDRFNVFIPNCQKDLYFSYKDGNSLP